MTENTEEGQQAFILKINLPVAYNVSKIFWTHAKTTGLGAEK